MIGPTSKLYYDLTNADSFDALYSNIDMSQANSGHHGLCQKNTIFYLSRVITITYPMKRVTKVILRLKEVERIEA